MLLDNHLENVSVGTLNIFCVSAELESFAGASEVLGITPATVSRCISRLEARLQVKLFSRTTRQVKLTEQGRIYHQSCLVAIKIISDAENDIINNHASPKGTLRISLPTTYGYYRLMPILVEFQRQYPTLNLDLDISNTNVDFIAQGFDLSVRLGTIKDSRLVAKKLEDASLGVFGSQRYFTDYGKPKTIEDLAKHKCIQFVMPNSGRKLPWVFKHANEHIEFTPPNPTYFSGDVLGAIRYANEGGGIFQSYDFIAQHPDNHHLVEVLEKYRGGSRPFNLIYPYSKYLPQKLRVFIDFVSASLAKQTH